MTIQFDYWYQGVLICTFTLSKSVFVQTFVTIIMTRISSIYLFYCATQQTILGFTPIQHRPIVPFLLFAQPPSSPKNEDFPANLKRKVDAKRLPLGHVVPKETRTKGCK